MFKQGIKLRQASTFAQGALVSESQTKKDVLTICVVVKVYKKETVWSWEQQKFTKASDSYPLLQVAFPSKPIHPLMFHEWLTHEIYRSPPTAGCPSHAVTKSESQAAA